MVAYYPFNGNADDESGNNNNGKVNGATRTTDLRSHPSWSFNGTNTLGTHSCRPKNCDNSAVTNRQ